MRRQPAGVNPRLRDPLVDQLVHAMLSLRSAEECYRFLEDLCTIGEVRALAARLEVARLLAAGRTYEEIARRTGASSATISRVRRFLEYGADGYRTVLGRLARAPRQGRPRRSPRPRRPQRPQGPRRPQARG
ncbi:MAG: YerC/YecD family TrpR-related protein [Armatimonadota bacterium]|nr:YerC/YecD family TrpR-related protein [Armatimonadota bacterium]